MATDMIGFNLYQHGVYYFAKSTQSMKQWIKPWFFIFIHFHGVNNATMPDSKLLRQLSLNMNLGRDIQQYIMTQYFYFMHTTDITSRA